MDPLPETDLKSRMTPGTPLPGFALKLLIPREHGSWGMWLLPLISGSIAGAWGSRSFPGWAMLWFFVAALSAFLSYQPLEVLLGSSLFKVRSPAEKHLVMGWILLMAMIGGMAVFDLVLLGRGRVLWFAALGIACFAARGQLGLSRTFRVARQILGAFSLSSSAAAAYYVTAGFLDHKGLLLWASNWLFATGQIEYVQLRVRAKSAQSRKEKFSAGLNLFAYHLGLLLCASIVAARHIANPLFALAFIPAVLRIAAWIMSKSARIDFRLLGFSELFHSLAFNALLLGGILTPHV
ncbi:MAG TPA: YwiC-like family protein [Terriglobales bacterium]|nr:YwiC-like family protein [Terriglobales bacterium]